MARDKKDKKSKKKDKDESKKRERKSSSKKKDTKADKPKRERKTAAKKKTGGDMTMAELVKDMNEKKKAYDASVRAVATAGRKHERAAAKAA